MTPPYSAEYPTSTTPFPTTPFPKPPPTRRKPLTTQEKLAAAEAAKAKREAAKRKAEADLNKPFKKPKTPRYFAAPDENPFAAPPTKEQPPRVKLGPATNSRRKAMTTLEKIKEHEEVRKRVERTMANQRQNEKRRLKKEEDERARVIGPKVEGSPKAKDVSKSVKAAGEAGKGNGVAEKKPVEMPRKDKTEVQRDPSTVSIMNKSFSSPTSVKFNGKPKGTGVLFRPTARAVHQRVELQEARNKALLDGAKKKAKGSRALPLPFQFPKLREKGKTAEKEQEFFRLMDLPKETREKIWKLAVVYHPFSVWPEMVKGREQPDLAMSGRKTRNEVLEVFYGSNVFTVDITPIEQPEADGTDKRAEESMAGEGMACASAASKKHVADGMISELGSKIEDARDPDGGLDKLSKPENSPNPTKCASKSKMPDPIAEIKPWAKALECGGQLGKIQHWLFSCMPEVVIPPRRIPMLVEAKALVVYLRLRHQLADGAEIVPKSDADAGKDVVETNTKMVWRATVEVHREAACVLPTHELCGHCIVKLCPEWLNSIVGIVLRSAEEKGGMTAGMVVRVTEILRKRSAELVEHRCEAS